MLRDYYNQGLCQAVEDSTLVKDAGVKDILRNLVVSGTILGGAGAGGHRLGNYTMERMTTPASEAAERFLLARKAEGKFVDASEFLGNLNPPVARISPEELAYLAAKKAKQGDPSITISTQALADKSLKNPDFQDIVNGTNYAYMPNYGVASSSRGDPSILAHEALGHGSQKNLDPASMNSFLGVLTGKQKSIEADAWGRARKGYPVDQDVESACMSVYSKRQAGAVGGAVAGAGAGGGASALSLMALAELAARLKRTRRP